VSDQEVKTFQTLQTEKSIFRDKDNAKSASRVIAVWGALGGLLALIVGLVIAIVGTFSTATNAIDIAKVGKEIVMAAFGVFTGAGVTKAVSGIGEGIASNKKNRN
jgi:hypothetical protein